MRKILLLIVSIFSLTTMNAGITMTDEESLLYIIEEEKLARDVYDYLYSLWGSNQFINIKSSEQTHINTVGQILNDNNINYTLLPVGQFNNTELQALYNELIAQGSISLVEAYRVGMTIEDVDIYDLQIRIAETSTIEIINAYQFLICGSENHMRAFYNRLVASGGTYAPQFISVAEYNSILSGTNVTCVLGTETQIIDPQQIVYQTLIQDSILLKLENFQHIEIYNSIGKLVYQTKTYTERIDVSTFANGVYLLKIYDVNKTFVIRLIKE